MPHRTGLPAPQPLLIDAAGHACVAWWHAPAPAADVRLAPALPRGWLPGGALPLAVVLASSWGEEDLCAYDDQRALAIQLAEGGLGTLRFEWPDTGDSSAESGSTSVADALAAFDAAATQARALSGCGRLALAGVRIGALLAAHAAAARNDVDALVALMPVDSGRAFVCEQRLLGAGFDAPAPAPRPGESFDAADLPLHLGGFTQQVRHVEALSALQWPDVAGPSLREALVLWPSATPGRAAADALARMGLRVREGVHDDLADAPVVAHPAALSPVARVEIVRWLQALAGDPARSRGPREADGAGLARAGRLGSQAVAEAARLEAATGTVLALSAADARASMRLQAGGVELRERLVTIGHASEREPPLLAGVLGERAVADTGRTPRRALILLSSGRERRIGPHRLWVPFARERAARGDVVLRLDVAGIGDSVRHAHPDRERRPDPYDARCVADIARAAAWLRSEHGVGDVVVMGVCSGAFQAWHSALGGVDVQQVVAINPLIFHWRADRSLAPTADAFGRIASAAGAARSTRDPARWWTPLTGRASFRAIAGAVAGRARHALRLRARALARLLRLPLHDDLAAELARVSARGVSLNFVFSSRDPGLTLMREEAGLRGVRFARDDRVTVCEIEHADPTFASAAGRAALYARLDSLLASPSAMSPCAGAGPSHPAAMARPGATSRRSRS
jgi:dienelactone hydrolase